LINIYICLSDWFNILLISGIWSGSLICDLYIVLVLDEDKDQVETMSEEDIHQLMEPWMMGTRNDRTNLGFNAPPKHIRRLWRIGQLKRAKKEKRQKTPKAAKTDMDELIKRAAATDHAETLRSWRKILCLHM
jgi:hypothetical protein